MKRFFYSIEKERISRMYGGAEVSANVYRRDRSGNLVWCGTAHWCTRAYKGEESEVMSVLILGKLIPKTWAKDGYYHYSNGKFTIQKV